jgi:hypothetical protein
MNTCFKSLSKIISFSSPLKIIYEFFQGVKICKTMVIIPMVPIFVNVPIYFQLPYIMQLKGLDHQSCGDRKKVLVAIQQLSLF